MLKRLVIGLVVLLTLILADIITTVIGLSLGLGDLNPIYYAQGIKLFLLVKIGFSALVFPLYIWTHRYLAVHFPKYAKVVWFLVFFLVVFYVGVVANNLIVISQKLEPYV